VLRLAPRGDPHPELYDAYGEVRQRLGSSDPVAWTLRRFERDLLEALGFGLALDVDGEGEPIDPAARYRLDPEQGARRVRHDRGQGDRDTAATGRALLALGADRLPEAEDLASLRRAMREVLAHHLGRKGLKSWDMLVELGRLSRPRVE
jgi:DNA repair protein RecO (recombination protein O)